MTGVVSNSWRDTSKETLKKSFNYQCDDMNNSHFMSHDPDLTRMLNYH